MLFERGWWNAQEARMLRLNGRVARELEAHPQARRATIVPPVCNGLVCFSNYTSPHCPHSGANSLREPGADSFFADRH